MTQGKLYGGCWLGLLLGAALPLLPTVPAIAAPLEELPKPANFKPPLPLSLANPIAQQPPFPLPPVAPQTTLACGESGGIDRIGVLRFGQPVPCVLSATTYRYLDRPVHFYQFEGKEGEPIVLELGGSRDRRLPLNPFLVLLDRGGRVLFENDNSGTGKQRGDALMRVKLPATDTYFALVTNVDPQQLGRYSLLLSKDNTPYRLDVQGELTPNNPTLAADRSAFARYEFSGDGFARLRVASMDFDPVLYLLDAEGRVLAIDDDSDGDRNAVIEYPLPQRGTYTVVVNSYNRNGYGRFRLLVQ